MRGFAPCGACGAYVPTTGCRHWHPRPEPAVESKWREIEHDAKRKAAEAVAEFRRMMRLNST